jgi:hypothetical protein
MILRKSAATSARMSPDPYGRHSVAGETDSAARKRPRTAASRPPPEPGVLSSLTINWIPCSRKSAAGRDNHANAPRLRSAKHSHPKPYVSVQSHAHLPSARRRRSPNCCAVSSRSAPGFARSDAGSNLKERFTPTEWEDGADTGAL